MTDSVRAKLERAGKKLGFRDSICIREARDLITEALAQLDGMERDHEAPIRLLRELRTMTRDEDVVRFMSGEESTIVSDIRFDLLERES